jgi:hypothetical protein
MHAEHRRQAELSKPNALTYTFLLGSFGDHSRNRSLNDARVRVFTCSSSRQWPAYALDSLSRAKDACDALLPESLVEPAADF